VSGNEPIGSIPEFFAAFDKAKGHLHRSEREFLLAFREALGVFIALGEQTSREALGLPLHILRIMVAAVDVAVAALPDSPADDESVRRTKATALNQLIMVLDDEIIRTMEKIADPTDLAKVEALQSLVKYLEAELKRLSDDTVAAQQRRQRITRIDVE
jgi:hypothetical protein